MTDAITQDAFKLPKVRTIRLYGQLGAKFGREYRLAVANTAEAVRALSAQLPGFAAYLNTAKDRGVVFAVFPGKRNIGEQQLRDPPGQDEIRIAPVLQGSKRAGVLQTIVGVVLIIVGAVTSWSGGVYLINLGVASRRWRGSADAFSPAKRCWRQRQPGEPGKLQFQWTGEYTGAGQPSASWIRSLLGRISGDQRRCLRRRPDLTRPGR